MYYANNTHDRDREQKAMEAQQEREARRRLTEEFVELLRLRPEDGARWTGTMMDLMEAAHIAYEQGSLHDEDGHPGSFYSVARRVCLALRVTPPANPHSCATRAAQRKGVREEPFLLRYKWLLFKGGVENPLMKMIEPITASPKGGEV